MRKTPKCRTCLILNSDKWRPSYPGGASAATPVEPEQPGGQMNAAPKAGTKASRKKSTKRASSSQIAALAETLNTLFGGGNSSAESPVPGCLLPNVCCRMSAYGTKGNYCLAWLGQTKGYPLDYLTPGSS